MTSVLRFLSGTVVVSVLFSCGSEPQSAAPTPSSPASVVITTIALHEQHAVEMLSGTVEATIAATLMARVPGTVARIVAVPGTTVAAGAVLVELDAQEFAAKRDQAKAVALQAANDLARTTRLFEKDASTKAELDTAQARAASSAAAAAEAEIMVGYTHINAPFAGVVVSRHVEVGALLAPGRPVIDLEDPSAMRLAVAIPASLAAQITLGTSLHVQVAAAGLDLNAEVSEVTPATDPVSRSVLVKLTLPAGTSALRSGQFGRVAIPIADGQSLMVPTTAIVHRGQLDAVFVIHDGTANLRLVRLGGTTGKHTAIRAGLKADEVIVSTDAENLRDGQAVMVR